MTEWQPPRYLPISTPTKFPINPDISKKFLREFIDDDPRSLGIPIHMNAADRFQLYYAARVLTLPTISLSYVDIGTFGGGSALLVYNALKRVGRQFRGWTMDPNLHPNLDSAKTFFKDRVKYLQMTSHDAAKIIKYELEEDRLDFVFVDGRHDKPYPMQDALIYFPLLRDGGIMLFHDYFLPYVFEGPHDPVWDDYSIYETCTELETQLPIKVLDIPLLSTDWHDPVGYNIPGVYTAIRGWRKII